MGTSVQILIDYLREFIPAHKVECLILGFGAILMSACLAIEAHTSGLYGPLTYLTLHPGVTGPGFLGGAGLVAAALALKPVEMP